MLTISRKTALPLLVVTFFGAATVSNVGAFSPPHGCVSLPAPSFRRHATTGANILDNVDKRHEMEDGSEKFDWFKAWYPLINVEILDVETPHHFQLFGVDLVVWNDGPTGSGVFGPKSKAGRKKSEGTWRAFVDQCPHRKVPLSEGRIENDGSLMCSYHGWRFDGGGTCISVPQISDSHNEQAVRDNPRTNCHAFPTKVQNGILFVWPSSDENAVLESELTPIASHPDLPKSDRLWEGPWNFRELPYSYDYFIENVVDPAHVSVSHHKLAGNRYDPQDIQIDIKQPLSKDGFSIQATGPSFESLTRFIAPSTVAIDRYEGGAKQMLELYCSPSRPGFCYHIGRLFVLKNDDGSTPKFLRDFTRPVPMWLSHVLSSLFLNQDALFLHFQERALNDMSNFCDDESRFNYANVVCLQNSDTGVVAFRRWLHRMAGGSIPYKTADKLPAASRDAVFNVWDAHTRHCNLCQVALRRAKKLRFASFFSATALALVRPSKLKTLGNLAVTLGLAGVGLAANKLIGMFYFYEFTHAQND